MNCTCKIKVDIHKSVGVYFFHNIPNLCFVFLRLNFPWCSRPLRGGNIQEIGTYSKIRDKGGKEMGKKGTPRRKWSKGETLQYIRLYLEEHISLMEIKRRYGVRNNLIAAWVKQYLEEVRRRTGAQE